MGSAEDFWVVLHHEGCLELSVRDSHNLHDQRVDFTSWSNFHILFSVSSSVSVISLCLTSAANQTDVCVIFQTTGGQISLPLL